MEKVSTEGLSEEEARGRLAEYGFNEIEEKKHNSLWVLAKKFWGLTPWMLEVTIVLELALGKTLEAYVITGLLCFNAAVSYIQEEKANGALALLRRKLSVQARVKRGGRWLLVEARELVPGDLVRLRAGDLVPADVEAAEGGMSVDQSVLTGESLPVDKEVGGTIYSGSLVRSGEATGIVTATGTKTYFGKTAELVRIARPKMHIEEMISRVVRWLLVIVVLAVAGGMGLAVARGISIDEITPLTVVLLISAVPVALPTMFTISLALGSLELTKRDALVTRLDAIEDAATMDVLCADKTGTITSNRLELAEAWPVTGHKKADVALYGALASEEANQDPIDLAFIEGARKAGIDLSGYRHVSFTPFDPSKRRTEVTVEKDGIRLRVMKGAVNTVVPMCRPCEESEVHDQVDALARRGYRVLAVARSTDNGEEELVGYAALYDRPRPEAPGLIRQLKEMGISVKMLTGDALNIAVEVASQAGLGQKVSRISDLKEHIDTEETGKEIEDSDGFAEIYPEDKYLIVKSLQGRNHIVGMTGDGVNDAPSLRQAEVGIAVKNATDIAKQASSVVLTSEGFEGIVETIIVGRKVYQRITSWTINKMIRTFKRVVFIVIAFILTGQFVVSTLNLILLLFLSDYVTLSISTDNVRYSSKPERWNMGGIVRLGILYGSMIIAESLLVMYIGMGPFGMGNNIDRLRTFIFTWLTLSGYFTVISIRERRHFWASRPSKWLALALSLNTVLVYFLVTTGLPGLTPITTLEVLFILGYGFVTCLLINDLVKVPLAEMFGIVV